MTAIPEGAYLGVDNLEVMEEALNYNAFLRSLVTARARPTDEILDFGAGSGVLAHPLAAAGYHIRCVEPDNGLRARLQTGGLEAHAIIQAVPTESLDLIYTVNVLEHIPDDAGAVTALRARLKPGGRLITYVPAFPILYSSMDRKVGHIRRYRRAALADLLRRTGLRVEHIAYQDSLGFAATLMFKLFGNECGTINRRALLAYDQYVFPLSRRLDRYVDRWFGKNLFAVARRHD
jgi:SAM-dependent methyltransferase